MGDQCYRWNELRSDLRVKTNTEVASVYVCIYFLIRNLFVCLLASSLKSKMLVNGFIK
jgi:hypothetical protein